MHASHSNGGFKILSEGHQFSLGGLLTATDKVSGSVLTLLSEDHKLARVDFADIMGLHVVGKEVLSGVVHVAGNDSVLRSSESVKDNLERVLRSIGAVDSNEIALHVRLFGLLLFHN